MENKFCLKSRQELAEIRQAKASKKASVNEEYATEKELLPIIREVLKGKTQPLSWRAEMGLVDKKLAEKNIIAHDDDLQLMVKDEIKKLPYNESKIDEISDETVNNAFKKRTNNYKQAEKISDSKKASVNEELEDVIVLFKTKLRKSPDEPIQSNIFTIFKEENPNRFIADFNKNKTSFGRKTDYDLHILKDMADHIKNQDFLGKYYKDKLKAYLAKNPEDASLIPTELVESKINEISDETRVKAYTKRVQNLQDADKKLNRVMDKKDTLYHMGNYNKVVDAAKEANDLQKKEYKHRLNVLRHDRQFGHNTMKQAEKKLYPNMAKVESLTASKALAMSKSILEDIPSINPTEPTNNKSKHSREYNTNKRQDDADFDTILQSKINENDLLTIWKEEIGNKTVKLIEDSPYANDGFIVKPSEDGKALVYGLIKSDGSFGVFGSIEYNPNETLETHFNKLLEKAYSSKMYGAPKEVVIESKINKELSYDELEKWAKKYSVKTPKLAAKKVIDFVKNASRSANARELFGSRVFDNFFENGEKIADAVVQALIDEANFSDSFKYTLLDFEDYMPSRVLNAIKEPVAESKINENDNVKDTMEKLYHFIQIEREMRDKGEWGKDEAKDKAHKQSISDLFDGLDKLGVSFSVQNSLIASAQSSNPNFSKWYAENVAKSESKINEEFPDILRKEGYIDPETELIKGHIYSLNDVGGAEVFTGDYTGNSPIFYTTAGGEVYRQAYTVNNVFRDVTDRYLELFKERPIGKKINDIKKAYEMANSVEESLNEELAPEHTQEAYDSIEDVARAKIKEVAQDNQDKTEIDKAVGDAVVDYIKSIPSDDILNIYLEMGFDEPQLVEPFRPLVEDELISYFNKNIDSWKEIIYDNMAYGESLTAKSVLAKSKELLEGMIDKYGREVDPKEWEEKEAKGLNEVSDELVGKAQRKALDKMKDAKLSKEEREKAFKQRFGLDWQKALRGYRKGKQAKSESVVNEISDELVDKAQNKALADVVNPGDEDKKAKGFKHLVNLEKLRQVRDKRKGINPELEAEKKLDQAIEKQVEDEKEGLK